MTFLHWYLIGVALATLITIILFFGKNRILVSDILESLVNICSSWAFLLAILMKVIITVLNATGKNAELYKRKGQDKHKLIRMKD